MSHPIGTRSRRGTARGAVAVLALALGLLSACGGDDGGSGSAGTTTNDGSGSGSATTITATEADFSITLDEDTLTAGDYAIEVVNDGGATHDLVVERDGEDVAGTDTIAPGESTTLNVTLDEGEYIFYCSIGNHRAMGMEVTVQVGS